MKPERYACPPELTLNRLVGESGLLVAGGVLDQPAGAFFAQRRAGYVAWLLDQETKTTATLHIEDMVDSEGLKLLRGDRTKPDDPDVLVREGLMGLRKRIMARERAANGEG